MDAGLRLFLYFFLQCAVLNALLRTSPESDLTLFRLLLPIAASLFFLKNPRAAVSFFVIALVMIFFQFLSWLVSTYPLSYVQFSFFINYLVMIFIYMVVKRLLVDGSEGIWGFIFINQCALLVALCLQYFTGYVLPNINDPEGALNAWYWNENDASLALASFVMMTIFSGSFFKMIVINAASISFILYNGSRGAVVGIIISLFFVYFIEQIKRGEKGLLVLLVSSVFCFAVFVGAGPAPEVAGDLLLSVKKVAALDSSGEVLGSNQVRAMVLVYSVKEFIDSWFLGIGAGNSILMLQSGKYPFIEVVKSIHNMPMQLLLELGVILFVIIIFLLKNASPLRWYEFFAVVFSYFLVSITQSGGFVVNYFALMCFLCVVLNRDFQVGLNAKAY